MRLSETITIYLAVGAPFGVSCYLRAQNSAGSRRRAFVEGIAAAFFWPLAASAILFKRLRHVDEKGGADEPFARVEEAGRSFVVSVNKMLEVTRHTRRADREKMERTLYALRESAEQYVGLAGAETAADREVAPARFEMEMARISGRRGDDLLIAGRCAHRRNISRTKARYERERSRLLNALAGLRMEEDISLPAYLDDADRAERKLLSAARLEIYVRAMALFSLLEDDRAAKIAAPLLDEACYGLRRLHESNADTGIASAAGEERCTEQTPQLIYKDRPRETTFTTG